MKNILIIGGTRNMGYDLTLRLVAAGHRVTVLNRGRTRVELPDGVHRLHADRSDEQQMQLALLAKDFDVVVDFVLFTGDEAQSIVNILQGRIGQYIMISSGQVYLVREGIERPYSESEYAGRLQPAPKPNTFAYEEWRYGMGKREAEDILFNAHAENNFPVTTLRLPMVNSERDSFKRLYSYILRLKDGGPILVPATPSYPLRHVYGKDVVTAIQKLIDNANPHGESYNISQDETVTLDEFLALLGEIMAVTPHAVRIKRSELEANGFVPDCSPFSERWMSELTNDLSKTDLDMVYTPLSTYLEKLVTHYYDENPQPPVSYKRRSAEIRLAEEAMSQM